MTVSVEDNDICCYHGHYGVGGCSILSIGTLEILVADIDHFRVLLSPIFFCEFHATEFYLYGYRNEKEKAFLNKKDRVFDGFRWYTMISYQNEMSWNKALSYFGRRYHITEKLLEIIIKFIFINC